MFPNPQDALPLPKRPNPEHYKIFAGELLKACKSADPGSIRDWANKWVNLVVQKSGIRFTPGLPVALSRWVEQVAEFAQRRLVARVIARAP